MAERPSACDGAPSCFPGLAWAVPRAYAGALSGFRFEEGDVLYRDPRAYAPLGQPPDPPIALQIVHPPRGVRIAALDGAEGDRRAAAWVSPVVLDRIELETGASERIETTQGRLLMLIWRDDDRWLESEHEAPPVPLGARDLAGRLAEFSETAAEESLSEADADGWRFLFVVDLASDASRVKARAVHDALAALAPVHSSDRHPAEAGLADAERFHPLLVVRSLVVRGIDRPVIEGALRSAVYGGKSSAPDGEGDDAAPDRFSVSRHGRLESLRSEGELASAD